MRFYISGRGEGKTSRLIEWAKNAPEGEVRVIVTHSLMETNRLQRENPDMASWQFVNLEDVRGGFALAGRAQNIVLGIDNLDLVLRTLLRTHLPIEFVTATGEVERHMVAVK